MLEWPEGGHIHTTVRLGGEDGAGRVAAFMVLMYDRMLEYGVRPVNVEVRVQREPMGAILHIGMWPVGKEPEYDWFTGMVWPEESHA